MLCCADACNYYFLINPPPKFSLFGRKGILERHCQQSCAVLIFIVVPSFVIYIVLRSQESVHVFFSSFSDQSSLLQSWHGMEVHWQGLKTNLKHPGLSVLTFSTRFAI